MTPNEWWREGVGEPGRLAALHRSGLFESAPEDAFDRLTELAAAVVQAAVALPRARVCGEVHRPLGGFDAQRVITRRAGAEACREVGELARPVSKVADEFGCAGGRS